MKLLTSNLLITLLIISTLSITITAQQSDSTKQKITSLQKGSWSMQFAYNNLGFDSFKGGNISAKYHFKDNNALRFGVNLYFQNVSKDGNSSIQPSHGVHYRHELRDFVSIGFFTDYVHYFSTSKSVNLFIASGPFAGIGYSNLKAKDSFPNIDSVTTIGFLKSNSWFVGAEFSIGVEWFVTSNFSLHGEYATKIKYEYLKQVNNSTRFGYNQDVFYAETISKYFTFSPDNVLIGVSFYF